MKDRPWWTEPVSTLLCREIRAHGKTRRLQRATEHERDAARARCAVLEHEVAELRRDADLLALMARDRGTALAFIRDRHRIVTAPEAPRSAP